MARTLTPISSVRQADIHTARIPGKPLQEVHRFLLTDAMGLPIDDPIMRDRVVRMVRVLMPLAKPTPHLLTAPEHPRHPGSEFAAGLDALARVVRGPLPFRPATAVIFCHSECRSDGRRSVCNFGCELPMTSSVWQKFSGAMRGAARPWRPKNR